MRVIVQRVDTARLTVQGRELTKIGNGLLVYVSVAAEDNRADVEYVAKKIMGLRIFSDEQGKFNLDLLQVAGEVLLISNFTIHGDARKGRRPSFTAAAQPQHAQILLAELAQKIRSKGITVAQGKFAAHMHVQSVNDGPVNILLDSAKLF